MKTALFNHLCALAEPLRVRLLYVLAHDEFVVGELAKVLQTPQSTISRHLKVLLTQGWVEKRQVGTASMFHMAESLPTGGASLWQVVVTELNEQRLYEEDRRRAETVLAQRELDGRDFFGRYAGQWDELRRELFGSSHVLPTLTALLPPGLVVADLGCGTGEAIAELAPVVAQVYGIDQEAAMLKAAALRTAGLQNVVLMQGDLGALPLPDATLDAALCMLVLHHVDDLSAFFAEVRRVLRPTGRLVLLDMVAHDRRDYRRTMGHRHLGFAPESLDDLASTQGMRRQVWRLLPPEPSAQGPGLFVAVFGPAA